MAVRRDELEALLSAAGIDAGGLKTLREIATQDDDDLAEEPETEVERQFPIYLLATSPESCVRLWQQLREISSKTGHYPVILGDQQNIGGHWEHREHAQAPSTYLEKAQGCEAKMLLDGLWDDLFADDEEFPEADIRGQWNENAVPYQFKMNDLHLTSSPVYIGMFETTASWETPAYLSFGNWNDCPPQDEHVCIQRYWHSVYQSELLAMTHDIVICHVHNPPTSRESALDLAREQMAYCSDILTQGVGTLDALAGTLMNSRYCFFWWD